jgi:hypothetical protein
MPPGPDANASYAGHAAGNMNSFLDEFCVGANAWRDDVYSAGGWTAQGNQKSSLIIWRPWFEMNANWMPWAIGGNGRDGPYSGMTVANFKSAWIYTRTRMRNTNGSKHIRFHLCPSYDLGIGSMSARLKDYYPGDAYVDYMGYNIYDGAGDNSNFKNIANGWDNMLADFEETPARPVIAGEVAMKNMNEPPQGPLGNAIYGEGGNPSGWNNDSHMVTYFNAWPGAFNSRPIYGVMKTDYNLSGSPQRWSVWEATAPSKTTPLNAFTDVMAANTRRLADTTNPTYTKLA